MGVARGRRTCYPGPSQITIGRPDERCNARPACDAEETTFDATMSRGVQDAKMAEHHATRASGIARHLDTSVHSDDVDAIERLRERISGREARRDRIKAYNASCRKGTPDPSLLTASERNELEGLRRIVAYQLSKGAGFPSYVLTNLDATIRKDKERIAEIERRARRAAEAEDNSGVVVRTTGEYCTVTFAQKPDRAILNALKAVIVHRRT